MALFWLNKAREAERVTVEGTTMWSVAVSQHKTASKGSAVIFMTELQHQAFLAYLKFYRPLVVPCDEPSCFVFPSSIKVSQECCKNMEISSISKCLLHSLKKDGLDPGRLLSRNNCRSEITMMRELFPDDQTKKVLASLAAHSSATHDRSYNYARLHHEQAGIFLKMKKVSDEQLRQPPDQQQEDALESSGLAQNEPTEETEDAPPQEQEQEHLATSSSLA